MAKAPTSEKIKLKNVRLSFPNLDTPTAFKDGQEKKFKASFLLDPSNPEHAKQIATIKSEAMRILKEKWGSDIPKASLEKCFGTEENLDKVYDGYAGMFWIRASSSDRPLVGNRRGGVVAKGDPQFPYGGCYVNANLTLWVQDSHGRKAVNGNLLSVQFVNDGEAFGRPALVPEEEFEAYEDGPAPAASSGSDDDFLN